MPIGIDIIETKRIKLDEKFLVKFLSTSELKMLNSFESKERKIEFAAGRWAVKEAIIKISSEPIPANKIDIGYHMRKPIVLNLELQGIEISISHEKNYAVAVAYMKG